MPVRRKTACNKLIPKKKRKIWRGQLWVNTEIKSALRAKHKVWKKVPEKQKSIKLGIIHRSKE